MNLVGRFRSVRFWLPGLLLLLTVGFGAVLYYYEARTYGEQFDAEFQRNEVLRAARVQAEIERWCSATIPTWCSPSSPSSR